MVEACLGRSMLAAEGHVLVTILQTRICGLSEVRHPQTMRRKTKNWLVNLGGIVWANYPAYLVLSFQRPSTHLM